MKYILENKRGGYRMKKHHKRILCLLLTLFILITAIHFSEGTADAASGAWKHDKKGYWYSYSDGSYAKNTWLELKGKWYYVGSDGYMKTGWQKLGGKWYYFSKYGTMMTGWQKISGKSYYFKKNGVMATDEWYNGWYLSSNGVWKYKQKGSWKSDSKGWWFGTASGWCPKNQWVWIDGKRYYFDSKGYLATNQWIGTECVNASGAWVPNASTAWAEAYYNYLWEHYDELNYSKYYLLYLDEDSIPEIIKDNVAHFEPKDIFTYYGGKVYQNTPENPGGIEYIDHGNRFIISEGQSGLMWLEVDCIKKGKLTTLGSGTVDYGFGDYENDPPICSWNGKNVTEKQYNNNLNKIFDSSKAIWDRAELYTFSELSYLLWSIYNSN